MADSITFEEWLAELTKLHAMSEDADGLTTAEIAQQTGQTVEWVRGRLQLAQRQGLLRTSRKRVRSICGYYSRVPAYRLVPLAKKKKP